LRAGDLSYTFIKEQVAEDVSKANRSTRNYHVANFESDMSSISEIMVRGEIRGLHVERKLSLKDAV
jgi:hypothetical protein